MGSRRQIFEMKGSLALLICLSFTLGGSQANPQVGGEPDCQSDICVDCRASCDGCNKCPLCSLVQKACDARKKLNFQGQDICRNCSYCRGGKDECKRKCLEGKEKPTCQYCKNNSKQLNQIK